MVMMIMSLNLPVNSFPLKKDSRQTVVLGFNLLYLVPIMDLFQMMGECGLLSLELWRKYIQDKLSSA